MKKPWLVELLPFKPYIKATKVKNSRDAVNTVVSEGQWIMLEEKNMLKALHNLIGDIATQGESNE